ncbi:hypothetical protein EDD15DRAFT_2192932 [Pisolithus albus]|nr:hypothetical protein EDD15DRAFT_2192932 [Pisolithus albus]
MSCSVDNNEVVISGDYGCELATSRTDRTYCLKSAGKAESWKPQGMVGRVLAAPPQVAFRSSTFDVSLDDAHLRVTPGLATLALTCAKLKRKWLFQWTLTCGRAQHLLLQHDEVGFGRAHLIRGFEKAVHAGQTPATGSTESFAPLPIYEAYLRRQTRVIAVSPSDINNNRGHRLVDGGKMSLRNMAGGWQGSIKWKISEDDGDDDIADTVMVTGLLGSDQYEPIS